MLCVKAFKRASESMEKLMDVVREELPDTMAAVRLSGMEISDLTMELSDLGLASKLHHFSLLTKFFHLFPHFPLNSLIGFCSQEITQGVKSSTRAVRVVEERLRRLTNMGPSGYLAIFFSNSFLSFAVYWRNGFWEQ